MGIAAARVILSLLTRRADRLPVSTELDSTGPASRALVDEVRPLDRFDEVSLGEEVEDERRQDHPRTRRGPN